MAMKYCDKHQIWYDYNDTCPECTKFGRIAGNIIGGSIFAVGWAGKKIYDKIKEGNDKKEISQEHNQRNSNNFNLGIKHYNNKNYNEAVKCFLTDANKGDANAQLWLGCSYSSVGNYTEAFKWYQTAAQQGHNLYKENLGFLYNTLGIVYQNGTGVAQNYTEAEKWYQMAIQQGVEQAVNNLKRLKIQINNDQRMEQKAYKSSSSQKKSLKKESNIMYCIECGRQNPSNAKFCSHCGHKQSEVNYQEEEHNIQQNEQELTDIKKAIEQVIDIENVAAIIYINDYYVQFVQTNTETPKLLFESVSSEFVPTVGNKDYEFKKLGFIRNSNYQKFIPLSGISIDNIIQEMKTIFETIYNVKFQSYEIEIYPV